MENVTSVEQASLLLGAPTFLILAMVMCLSFLTACAAIYLFQRVTAPNISRNGTAADVLLSSSSAFLFSDKNLVFVTSKGKSVLDSVTQETNSWDKLRQHLTSQAPSIGAKLDELRTQGCPFFEVFRNKDGITQEIEGRPQRGFISISIQTWSPEKASKRLSNDLSDQATQQVRSITTALDALGLPLWSRTKDGELLWCNPAYRALSSGGDQETEEIEPIPAFFAVSETDAAPITNRRVSITTDGDAQSWHTLHEYQSPNGAIFGYAQNADDIVKVETALNRFVATLTESFAHLSTGLAIFDANRRLTIFNPAIADLMRIDPGWLATGPGFRDFMSRVREGQMMPEQKTTADWKKRVQKIEMGAQDGSLSEKWVLPSGQTLKVTGRPHPRGAIALMIEDISTHISLERQYKSEIEQSRATLDFLTDAVCVFDTTGALVYANSACADLWGIDTKAAYDHLNVVSATASWGASSKPTPVWGDLREFVTSLDQRAAWTADIERFDGTHLSSVFAPLPDGSTLAIFTKSTIHTSDNLNAEDRFLAATLAHREEVAILELALDHMREAVTALETGESQVSPHPKPSDKIAAQSAETVSSANRLLSMRRAEIAHDDNGIDSLSRDLLGLLKERDAELSLSCDTFVENGHLGPDVKRLLINIMLVAGSLVAPKETVDLSVAEMGEGISISCMFKSLHELANDPEKGAGLSYRIMMRYLKDLGGEGEIVRLDRRDFVKISCTIPTTKLIHTPPAQVTSLAKA